MSAPLQESEHLNGCGIEGSIAFRQHTVFDRLRSLDGLVLIASAAFLVGSVIRIFTGHELPLWIDETFTGAIADQPSGRDFLHQIWADVNAPLYYCFMYNWVAVAGLSNDMLRWPSTIFSLAAVLLAYRGISALDRTTRLIWGALLSLWLPGLYQASEARCYALLLLITLATTLVFAKLMASPNRRLACCWGILASLSILTHYFAALLIIAQGFAFLVVYRTRALRIWPAGLFFIPTALWISYHLPRLLEFGNPDVAWYAILGPQHLPFIINYVLNSFGFILILIVAAILILKNPSPAWDWERRSLFLVAAASAAGLLILIAVGMMRPSFTLKYAIPFMPGILLGVALTIERAARHWPRLPALAIFLFGLPMLLDFDATALRKAYSFEAASTVIERAGAKRVVFLWDHPSSIMQDTAQMRAFGGFFLARSGRTIDVVNVANPWREDPQPRLLAAAGSEPGTAILWVYDRLVPKTAALAHPPHIERLDPAWQCRDYTTAPYAALVCLRAPS
ncbi:glycosyltransferase family 39 protein [Methylobacterium pseudosasicola]|uniref:Dolichyl-phosphate-mannose-protein mannosyltransferase n=1 Tax=Methylobacterium pseudosasicola TaxID=582667 RepID=A0A1I4NMZ6_9HYPH|nr:glycosyltransferase family 39 protein [Methylobacterium pseudosasicola]SFM16888.1 Dolichyl-phosphate-mannose-protein mannosyltransferase [Methylobacterium pseudosasicola]